MNVSRHSAANIVVAVPLWYFLGWDWKLVTIFIFAGVAIDIDHLFYFLVKCGQINPAKWISIGKAMRKRMQSGLYIFHSPEFNLLLLATSFFSDIIFVIFISNTVHIILDTYEHYQYHKNFMWIKKWSVVYSLINYEKV